jgi:hypothetical protein
MATARGCCGQGFASAAARGRLLAREINREALDRSLLKPAARVRITPSVSVSMTSPRCA